MIILLGIILVSRVNCRTFLEDLSETPEYLPLSSEMMENINDEYDTYVDLGDTSGDSNEFDILSEQVFLNKLNTGRQFGLNKDREFIQTYILVKTMRQRNKRYVNYLTLCHFKICNIGRRSARHENLKRERKHPLKFRSKKN